MSDHDKKYKLFLTKAQYQIKQIQYSCREVIDMTTQLNMLSNDLSEAEVNSRKIEFIKGQIKDKLKQYANNVNEVYQILDKKLIILTKEVSTQCKNAGVDFKSGSANTTANKTYSNDRQTQKSSQKTHLTVQNDRFFTDTLNPRVLQLQAKITQYEQRQQVLNKKIKELKSKNQKLLEQFTNMSNASNKKINQLSYQLNNITSKDRDSFSSLDSGDMPRRQDQKQLRPFLMLDQKNSTPRHSPAKKNFQVFSDRKPNKPENEGTRPFTFGCMRAEPVKDQSREVISFAKNSDPYEPLDKQDRNRRFDILLTKLRYGQKQEQQTSQTGIELKKKSQSEDCGSVFSKQVVKRYQL